MALKERSLLGSPAGHASTTQPQTRLIVRHEAAREDLAEDDDQVRMDSRGPFEVVLASAMAALKPAALEVEPKAEVTHLSSWVIVATHLQAAWAEEAEAQSACQKSEVRNQTGKVHLAAQ